MTASRLGVACAALLLAAAAASAARYDPDFDRGALRQAASGCRASMADAAGVPLEPDNAPAIAARLDEGLGQAKLASAAAAALDAGARKRVSEMDAGLGTATDAKLKELSGPVEAERKRRERLGAESAELAKAVEGLPEAEKKKLMPLLEKADGALRSAADALAPLEDALRDAGLRAAEMRAARQDALGPFIEVSSSAAGVIAGAESLAGPAAEAKDRLGALGREPRAASRSRAWEKLELARDGALLLFRHADGACNRADDFRRRSGSYEAAREAFDKARAAASAGPGAARAPLGAAQAALALLRERLGKPRP